MTANDVYVSALAHLDEIATGGIATTDTDRENRSPLLIDAIQREIANLAGVNVKGRIIALTDTLSVSDDHALRVMPWGLAAELALQDNMEDEYLYCISRYREERKTVKPKIKMRDPYNVLAGMQ
jgi:hypothetical protein